MDMHLFIFLDNIIFIYLSINTFMSLMSFMGFMLCRSYRSCRSAKTAMRAPLAYRGGSASHLRGSERRHDLWKYFGSLPGSVREVFRKLFGNHLYLT